MIYNYRCKCGVVVEKNRTILQMNDPCECPSCGNDCEKVILRAPTVSLDPICGDHVRASDNWVKHRDQIMAKERHNAEEHGESGLKPR